MEYNLNIQNFPVLFDAVQRAEIFEDQKLIVDAVPKGDFAKIIENYNIEKSNKNFDLKAFILQNFTIGNEEKKVDIVENLPIEHHINELWNVLTRRAVKNKGSLIALPQPYIVPGGRFNEFFYWDSYFVMLGLQVSGRYEMAKNIVDNCRYLIEEIGFVPNANRTYFLSRSQPPFFSMMVELLAEMMDDDSVFEEYAPAMEKEYAYWMNGSDALEVKNPNLKVARPDDSTILNRYYDYENEPRPESFLIDVKDREKTNDPDFFINIRSACESGWDFSSRWFSDPSDILTIDTQNILPLDLNCILWHLESTLANVFKESDSSKFNFYRGKAEIREAGIQKFFWNKSSKVFSDYHLVNKNFTDSLNIAVIFPLYFKIATQDQAKEVAKVVEAELLKKGGLITTNINSGQQWDSPNAWAPFQWMAYIAFHNYGFVDLAESIKENWCNNVKRVYRNTGKLMEKYNAVDTESLAGGGEYPNQDGFGWTNAVYLKLKHNKYSK